jgi:hypothetical protein
VRTLIPLAKRMIDHRRWMDDGQRRNRNTPVPPAGKASRPAYY